MPPWIRAFVALRFASMAGGGFTPARRNWRNLVLLFGACVAPLAVQAGEIYTLATTSGEETFTMSFGKVNMTTGEYTPIVGNLSQTAYFSSLAWNPSGSNFLAFRERDLTTISVSGVVGGVVGSVPVEGDGLSWINHGLARSPAGTSYAYNYENDTFGTVTQSTPAYTQISASGLGTLSPVGGRLVFHGDTLFAAFNVGIAEEPFTDGLFGTIDPATGGFTQLANGAEFQSMVLASDGTTLFGLTPTTLRSLDPASGATLETISLYGDLPENWTGAAVAVPEPSTYVMAIAGVACGVCHVLRRRKRAAC